MTNSPASAKAAQKPSLKVHPQPVEGMFLRSITLEDQEILRQWKNLHRRAFFYQDIITPEMQRQWFAGYLERAEDWMFMVMEEERPAGCLGWRLWQGRADLYNVIRGEQARQGDGLMSRALRLLLSHLLAQGRADIVARVILGNPALGWYEHNGFVREQDLADHILLRLEETAFTPQPFVVSKGE